MALSHDRPILKGSTLDAGALGVVFVHGIKSSAATWDAVRESLAQTEDLAALEPQPPFEYATGVFGNKPVRMKNPLSLSDALRVLPSLDTIADSLVSYLDTEAAEFERLVLVGHSMGGLVIQRFLARMLSRGRGTDLARIRRVVLLACPNQGSDLALVLRKRYRLRNPQEKALRPFDEPVTDARAVVLAQIVNAPAVTANSCPIPFSVYAGTDDGVVSAASARSSFPNAAALPGNHFTILNNQRTFNTLQRLLREAAQSEPSQTADANSSTDLNRRDVPAHLPAPPIEVRLKPEIDTASNLLRLRVLNRGELGHFRVEVIDARDEDGNWAGPRSWPVPWLEGGSVGAKDVPKFGAPLLNLARFDFLGLQQDLDGTKWLNGEHWVFPSLPQPVTFSYSPVGRWSDLDTQYIVLTLRVIRDKPEGHVDVQFKIGADGSQLYCRELPEDAKRNEAGPEPAPMPAPSPALTNRWRHTSDGSKVPALMNLTHSSMSHPGYGDRQWEEVPPSVRVGMLIGCQDINQFCSGTELRAKLTAFLDSVPVRELLGSLTHVPADAAWTNLAGHGLLALEAALTTGDDPMEGAPVASALFLPPTTRAISGRAERTAALILYIEPRTASGQVPPAAGLKEWYRRFSLGLAIPGAFADFLSNEVGLGTFDTPAAQCGVWLDSHQPLTTMVDTNGLRMLPGSAPSNQFIGWAYADPDGKLSDGIAYDMMVQMCEYHLHLDDFESALPEHRE